MVFKENWIFSRVGKSEVIRFFQLLIKIYSYLVSPLLGKSCRYHPTCSCYMNESLERHGLIKGLFLGSARIISCHPYSKRNFIDPVPKQFAWRDVLGYKRQCHHETNDKIKEQEKLNEC